MVKRRRFSAEYKARVALEALVGDQTLSELSQKHGVHPNMIAAWKRQAKPANYRRPSARKAPKTRPYAPVRRRTKR